MKVGRGIRPSPETGKTDCLIIDLVGNCDRFPLGVEPSLDVSLGQPHFQALLIDVAG
jgi:hypothetical protein